MRTTIRTTAAALGVAALLTGGAVAGQAFASTAGETDGEVTSTLTFAREEERMARDLYAALAEKYDGARPFSMITRSEQQHFDSVGTLLDRYDVTDPAAGKAVGTYADPAIQKLYDGWLAEGSASLEAAYQVGVELETRDIADLEKSIAGGLPTDIDGVLGRLLQASQRHLAAYQRAVDGDLGTGTGAGAGTMGRWSDDGTGAGRGPGMGGRGGNGNGPGGNAGSGMNGMNGGDCPYTDTDD